MDQRGLFVRSSLPARRGHSSASVGDPSSECVCHAIDVYHPELHDIGGSRKSNTSNRWDVRVRYQLFDDERTGRSRIWIRCGMEANKELASVFDDARGTNPRRLY